MEGMGYVTLDSDGSAYTRRLLLCFLWKFTRRVASPSNVIFGHFLGSTLEFRYFIITYSKHIIKNTAGKIEIEQSRAPLNFDEISQFDISLLDFKSIGRFPQIFVDFIQNLELYIQSLHW